MRPWRSCWVVRSGVRSKLVGYALLCDLFDDGTVALLDEVAGTPATRVRASGAVTADAVRWMGDYGFVSILGLATDCRMQRVLERHGIVPGPPEVGG